MPNKRMNSIKDKAQYEKLRDKGMSKQKAARIANTGRKTAAKRGGKASSYDDMTKEQLYDKAKDVGIEGRSKMSKKELISALRR